MSADYAVSFFYFLSAFIGIYSMLKKYQKSYPNPNESHHLDSDMAHQANQPLTFKEVIKMIFSRWLRLSFPTYIILLFTYGLFPYFGSGPMFTYANSMFLEKKISEYWWTIILFVSNV